MSRQQWLAAREEEALKLDPETAEVSWGWGPTLDPYGVYDLTREENGYIQRNYFARAPGSEWVLFDDLPQATYDRLWARIKAGDFDDDDLSWLFDDTNAK